MAEKQPEFVISDRRRFSDEGELRPNAKIAEEEKQATPQPAKPAAPPQAAQPPVNPPAQPSGEATAEQQEPELSPPPTAEEQHQQNEAYKASTKKIDDMIAAAGKSAQGPMEINFERVVESFYMSALIQMGALRQEGETPRVDIIGARQTIDSLAVLQEKTKGNLTEREKTLLQNVLFELRMAWIEITNAVASSAAKPPAAPPGEKK
jgi:type IV secretory pathway VirB10-like protein